MIEEGSKTASNAFYGVPGTLPGALGMIPRLSPSFPDAALLDPLPRLSELDLRALTLEQILEARSVSVG